MHHWMSRFEATDREIEMMERVVQQSREIAA
jgi:hypothetical protein